MASALYITVIYQANTLFGSQYILYFFKNYEMRVNVMS